MTDTKTYLQTLLNHEIPLTYALGIEVESWFDSRLTLNLPLKPNMNHMSTAFGGSIYCAGVIAGWSWVHLYLKSHDITEPHIVVHHAHIDYHLPVKADALAICNPPEIKTLEKFTKVFKRYQKGRLELITTIEVEGEIAATFTGQFAVYCD